MAAPMPESQRIYQVLVHFPDWIGDRGDISTTSVWGGSMEEADEQSNVGRKGRIHVLGGRGRIVDPVL